MIENGNLYWIPYRFSLITFVSSQDIIDNPNISLKDALQLTEKTNVFPNWVTNDILFNWIIRFSLDHYIDWDNSTCDFASDYINLLKFCRDWGERETITSLDDQCLFNFENLQGVLRLGVVSRNYNGKYCFAGFPIGNGHGNMFQINLKLAIPQKSMHKEGAWEFIRYSMSEQGQAVNNGPGYSAINSIILQEVDKAIENKLATEYEEYDFTQVDSEKFWSLINRTNITTYSNLDVIRIIEKEAKKYLSGEKAANIVAKETQENVLMYLQRH